MSDYDLLLEPQVHDARKQLPGNVRQQVNRAIDGLASRRSCCAADLLSLIVISPSLSPS
jgi:hypothetical protein